MKTGIGRLSAVIGGILVLYCVLTVLLVQFEKNAEGTSISTVRQAVWYTIVTLTTVGYGDMYPVTPYGKAVGYIFVIGSLGILGFLIGRVSSSITEIREARKLGLNGTLFKNHIVVLGWDSFAESVVDELLLTGVKIAIITSNKNDVDLIWEKYSEKKQNIYALFADYNNFELLKKANINEANNVFVNFGDDTDKLVYLINCKKNFNAKLKYILIPASDELVSTFIDAGASFVLSREKVASKIIASYVFEPDVAHFTEDLLVKAEGDEDFDILEFRITEDNPFLNQKYVDVFFQMKEQYDCILIGMVKIDGERRILLKNPDDPAITILRNDYLIMIANGSAAESIQKAFSVSEGSLSAELRENR